MPGMSPSFFFKWQVSAQRPVGGCWESVGWPHGFPLKNPHWTACKRHMGKSEFHRRAAEKQKPARLHWKCDLGISGQEKWSKPHLYIYAGSTNSWRSKLAFKKAPRKTIFIWVFKKCYKTLQDICDKKTNENGSISPRSFCWLIYRVSCKDTYILILILILCKFHFESCYALYHRRADNYHKIKFCK